MAILRKRDFNKDRSKRHFYLLRNIVWVQAGGQLHKLYVTTPSGRYKSYSYYFTQTKPNGKKIHIPTTRIDQQIPEWLAKITIDSELVPAIQECYREQIEQISTKNRDERLSEFRQKLSKLRNEEAKLGRLLITEKISEESYDQLHAEWREKVHNADRAWSNWSGRQLLM